MNWTIHHLALATHQLHSIACCKAGQNRREDAFCAVTIRAVELCTGTKNKINNKNKQKSTTNRPTKQQQKETKQKKKKKTHTHKKNKQKQKIATKNNNNNNKKPVPVTDILCPYRYKMPVYRLMRTSVSAFPLFPHR